MPNFWPFFKAWTRLNKIDWNLTVYPTDFNNTFLKSFGLLQNLMRNCEILQKLTKFHDTEEMSWNFIGIVLCFRSVAMYLVQFRFRFWCFQKLTAKFQFHSNRFENFKVSNLVMAKVKKVNIAVTYLGGDLALSSHCRILTVTPLASKADQDMIWPLL